ncbi:MAG: efflux RND transporter periplasmic adaptor subunit [Pseudomonadota bacterium]
MRKTYLIAGLIAIAITAWLFSGQTGQPSQIARPTIAEQNASDSAASEDRPSTRVRARLSEAQTYVTNVKVRGRTENKRSVVVRSETVGRVIERPIEKGQRVAAGDLLCELAVDDRRARLVEAQEGLNRARIEYQGALRLKQRGFQADADIARSKASLASAQADLERAKLSLAQTQLRAPFNGVVEDTRAELGDYLQPGAECATLIDLDPMLLVGAVSERDVHSVTTGGDALGVLGDGRELAGTISFVGQQSDPSTRTYRVEVSIPNADYAVRSGMTAEIRLPVGTVRAHLVSPALLALDTEGNLGLRTLDAERTVIWNAVAVIGDGVEGAWVTGLPESTHIITVGQELVVPGETVEVRYEGVGEQPAAAPSATDKDATAGETPPDSLGTVASNTSRPAAA